jgi:hypothetical protein
MLAQRTRKRLRFAVLRPKDQSLVDVGKLYDGMPYEDAQKAMNDSLREGAIFVGCVKPRCRDLFALDGTPTGDTLKPGDVFDDLQEFLKRCHEGVYRKVDS